MNETPPSEQGLGCVLVVEDDATARALAVEVLRLAGHQTREAESVSGALELYDSAPESIDLVLTDVRLGGADGLDGMDLLGRLLQRDADLPVVLLTAFGDVEGAMAATRAGAWDYLAKPFQLQELRDTVGRGIAHRRLIRQNNAVPAPPAPSPASGVVGRSPAMLAVYKLVAKVAMSSAPVLVLGESGVGKELVARALHAQSTRSRGPFVAISCAALPDSLLESELFGHERGAFTGADRIRRGLFEQASGGTLFLDEIGEISPRMQAQLLRVLQEGEVRRLGSAEATRVDVRIVAATHRDLDEEVRAGRFREDLLFRLRVVSVRVPPLRERVEDIPSLAEYFLVQAARRENRRVPALARTTVEALQHYRWPGNARELRNAIERALAVAAPDLISPADLPNDILPRGTESISRGRPAIAPAPTPTAGPVESLLSDRPTLALLERRYVDLVLTEQGGNKTRAAEILGIDRRTLYRILDRVEEGPEVDPSPKVPSDA